MKLTHAEILALAITKVESDIRELEAKRVAGNKDIDELINQMIIPLKDKLTALLMLHELETGKKMYAD